MIAYIDSSVILRVVLDQPDQLQHWGTIRGVVSALAEVECLQTIDRFRLVERLSNKEVARLSGDVYRALEEMDVVAITSEILARASQPFLTVVGTLDAIHLATALRWREQKSEDLVIATHDQALAVAARAFGFDVIGLQHPAPLS